MGTTSTSAGDGRAKQPVNSGQPLILNESRVCFQAPTGGQRDVPASELRGRACDPRAMSQVLRVTKNDTSVADDRLQALNTIEELLDQVCHLPLHKFSYFSARG